MFALPDHEIVTEAVETAAGKTIVLDLPYDPQIPSRLGNRATSVQFGSI